VAFQDGDGAWTRVAPVLYDRFAVVHLSLESPRGGLAVARDHASTMSSLVVQYAAARELANAGDQQLELCGITDDRTLTGSVKGLAADELAVVSSNRSTREVVSLNRGSDEFTLGSVSTGPQEILITRLKNVDGVAALTGFILRHSDDLAEGTVPCADFGSSEVFLPVTRQVSLTNFGEGAISRSGIRTLRSPDRVTTGSPVVTAESRSYTAAPGAMLGAHDLQFLSAETIVGNTSNVARTVTAYFREPVDLAIGFGAIPATPNIVTLPSSSGIRLRATLPAQPDYDETTSINYQQGQALVVSLTMTDRYSLLSGGTYEMSIPDLSDVAGFQPRWILQPGTPILWTTSRVGGWPTTAAPENGAIRRVATDAGFLTP
jgi:hypothetical protein